jgi:4-amino-4-deoxy-L-arabinose transferase-like glycosyltransferase
VRQKAAIAMKKYLLASLAWLKACPPRRSVVLLTLCALTAVSAHIIFVRFLPAPWEAGHSADFRTYYGPVAERLTEGKGLSLPSGKPAVRYPPGIPLLYGATFWTAQKLSVSNASGTRILQGAFVVAGAILIASIAFAIFPSRIALLASLLWSTYPLQLWLTRQPSGMNAFCVLLLLCVFLFLRWARSGRYAFLYGGLVGATLGLTSLVKPFAIALPIVFGLLAWLCSVPCHWRKRVLFSVCVVVMYVMVISPWEIWARRATGRWIPLSTDGPAAMIDGLSFGLVRHSKSEVPLPADVRSVARDVAQHGRQLTNAGSAVRFVIGEARERPTSVAHLFLIKAVRSWYGNDSHTHEKWIALIQLLYLPLVLFGARLAWIHGKGTRNFVLVAGALTLYYWAVTTFVALSIVRYMIPASALLMILAGSGLECAVAYCWMALAPRLRPSPSFSEGAASETPYGVPYSR